MGTSSAEPARLQAYPGMLTEADAQLATTATAVDNALAAFHTGAVECRPAGFDPSALGNRMRGVHQESLHLGKWVASVGAAFLAAAGGDPDGDGIFTVGDAILDARVGEPTIAGHAGTQDAGTLWRLLLAAGIDPRNVTIAQLNTLIAERRSPAARALYEQLEAIGDNMEDPAYANGFFTQLGTNGMRATLGVIDTFARIRQLGGLGNGAPMGSVQNDLLLPFAGGWAFATRNPETAGARAALLKTTTAVEQRHLAMLMSGRNPGAYDPQWLADGADRILVSGRSLNVVVQPYDQGMGPDRYPGFPGSGSGWPYEDKGLGVPAVIATRALAGNTDASVAFLEKGDPQLKALLYPERPGFLMRPDVVEAAGQLDDELKGSAARAVRNVVTHDDVAVRIPVMDRTITMVAANQDLAINSHLAGALADGVTSNMTLMDYRINDRFLEDAGPLGGRFTVEDPRRVVDTAAFLKEVMHDDAARKQIEDTTISYVRNNLTGTAPPGWEPIDGGRMLGVVRDAEVTVLTEKLKMAKATRPARAVDLVLGTPSARGGFLLASGAVAADQTLGDVIMRGLDNGNIEELEKSLRSEASALTAVVKDLPVDKAGLYAIKAGASDVNDVLGLHR